MILLIVAIVFSVLILTVEIPVFLRMRDGTDLEIALIAGLMLAGCIAILYWR